MQRSCFVILLLFSSSLFAQEKSSIGDLLAHDVSVSWRDGINYFNFPSRFDRSDYRNSLTIILFTPPLMAFDEPMRDAVGDLSSSKKIDGAMSVFRGYGEATYSAPIVVAGYAGGLIFDSPWLRVTCRQILQTLVYSGLTTTAIKAILGRARPFKNEGAFSFDPFTTQEVNLSMPSGHTTVAFAISSVLAERIGNTWASIGLYGLASLTGFSRMYHDKHWLSDVALGGAIATATGIYVVGQEENRETGRSESHLQLTPTGTGIALTYTF